MLKKILMIVFILLTATLSTGCWNQRELNELAIAMALGIDKVEDGVRVSIQVVAPQEAKDPSYYLPVTIYAQTADSVFEAFRKMTTVSPRKIYLPHFRILVIGEELAKEGMADVLDMLIRDHEFRSDFYIVISRNGEKAEDILQVLTPFEKIPANKMFSSLQTSSEAWAPTIGVFLDELLTTLATDGKEPVLTGIKLTNPQNKQYAQEKKNIEKSKPFSILRFEEIAVLKKDKLVGWLNLDESKGYNYAMGNVKSTVGRITCPNGGEAVVEVKDSKAEIIPHMKNGNPEIEIKLTNTVNIAEVICELNLKDPETISQLEKAVEERLSYLLETSVKAAQEKYNSDIFGFGNMIHKNFPKQWKQLEPDWDEKEFKKLPVTYTVKGIIKQTGTIDESLYSEFLKEKKK